ncbi:MAG TPA: type II toxin-antitoxin system prevent-host-death family antitoxin [Bosea sp. (in: a-proteobacteria)]
MSTKVAVSEAKGQLTELVRRAEAGEDVVLTRHGQPAVRLVPIKRVVDRATRHRLIESLQRSAAKTVDSSSSAARSQDFLYGDDGLPE